MVFGARAFFGYQTAPSGETFWFANLGNSEMSREETAAYGEAAWKQYALELFGKDMPAITTILRAAEPAEFRPWGVFDLVSLRAAFGLIRRFGSQRWITDHRVEFDAGAGEHATDGR